MRMVVSDSGIGKNYVLTFGALKRGILMRTSDLTEASANLYTSIDDASVSQEPFVITGKRGNAVHLAEEDWNAFNETLYLLSVPGMRESLIEGVH